MKDKLVKTGNDYILYSKDKTVLGITSGTMEGRMLSLKNCEAIENGYDLDEIRKLVDEDFECELGDGPTNNESINSMIKKSNANGAEWGFQKAIEILGDKKFSEEDIRNAMERVWYWHEDNQDKDCPTLYELIPKHIQSLQQTEWDVEIEMVSIPADRAPNGWDISPKLDEDGCLILRRI